MSDQELEGRLESLVSSERSATARLVAHLAEVLERRLHLKQAWPLRAVEWGGVVMS